MQNQTLGGGSLSRVASPSTQGTLSPSERMAESILSLLDEPDNTDKRWRAPIMVCLMPTDQSLKTALHSMPAMTT